MDCKNCKIKMIPYDYELESSIKEVLLDKDVQGMIFYQCSKCNSKGYESIKTKILVFKHFDQHWDS